MFKAKRFSYFLFLVLFMCGIVFITQTENVEAKVRISKKKISIYVGQEKYLTVKGTYKTVKWKSSKKSVASVDSYGYVKGKKPGKCTITAKVGKKKYKCKVTVKSVKSLVKINMPGLPYTVSEYDYRGRISDSYQITKIDYTVDWSSDGKYTVKLYFSGKKTYGSASLSSMASISYKIYRTNGSVFESDTLYTPSLVLGETFQNEEDYIWDVPKGTYNLEILNTQN